MRLSIVLMLMPLLLSGCLEFDTYEVRILREQGDPSIVVFDFAGIYSNATDIAEIQKDFEKLLQIWRGDEMVRDQAADGFLVKSRELFVRDAKVVGRQTGILNSLGSFDGMSVTESQIMLKGETGSEIVETNGKILKMPEGESVVWPQDATELRVKFRNLSGPPTTAQAAAMVKLLAEYEARIR